MSHVEFKACPCHPVDFRGLGTYKPCDVVRQVGGWGGGGSHVVYVNYTGAPQTALRPSQARKDNKPSDRPHRSQPKQHSMWAPVGPQLGKVGPQMGPGWARLGPIWECCLGRDQAYNPVMFKLIWGTRSPLPYRHRVSNNRMVN